MDKRNYDETDYIGNLQPVNAYESTVYFRKR